MLYVRLFFEFAITGLFAVGGGQAVLPFLYDMGSRTGWFDEALIANMLAISESTPGPIGVNMATYVGYSTAGVLGGIIATLGLIFPSVVVIIIISQLLTKFKNNPFIENLFSGLKPASTALIAFAGYGVFKIVFLNNPLFASLPFGMDIRALAIGVILFVLMRKIILHPVAWIVISAVVGIALKL